MEKIKIQNSRNYYVTRCGDIYSGDKRLRKNKTSCYQKVVIYYEDGTHKDQLVHRLVAQAFLPNPQNKPVVNHIDGNKHNNSVNNLEWATYSENSKHAVETGLIKRGHESQKAILSRVDVHHICRLLSQGVRVKDLVEKFGVSQPVISSIKCGTRYADISSMYEYPSRKEQLSIDTVLWVCHMLELGKSDKEISEMSKDGKLNRVKVRFIRTRRTFIDISKDFSF